MPVPRLLIIDDEPEVATLLGFLGERAGYRVDVTTDFVSFQRTYDDDVDALVLDLRMPDTDGVEVLRYLAARECRAALFLVSGVDRKVLATAEELATERGLNVVASVSKPFDPEHLCALLRSVAPAERGPVAGLPAVTVDDLRHALTGDQMEVLYQPKVHIRSRTLTGVEVLVRWQHPLHGLLPPRAFIDLAEAEGLAMTLTETVTRLAFLQTASWTDAGMPIKIAVNLSGRCLNTIDLPEMLDETCAKHGLRPEQVILEITESYLAADVATTLDVVTRLRLKQFELSIDDFGTGYATLQQLKRIPFTEMKLDCSFVRACLTDDESRSIVESSVHLGHALGLRVVAEGVETIEQWRYLDEIGCDLAQGFLIAPPMHGKELVAWLSRWRALEL